MNLPAPAEPEMHNRPRDVVAHIRICANPWNHWYGVSPLDNARLTSAVLARMEGRLGQEAGARAGYVLPMPDGKDGNHCGPWRAISPCWRARPPETDGEGQRRPKPTGGYSGSGPTSRGDCHP